MFNVSREKLKQANHDGECISLFLSLFFQIHNELLVLFLSLKIIPQLYGLPHFVL